MTASTLRGPYLDGSPLADVLAALGYTHAKNGHGYQHDIFRDGEKVFAGTAGETWAWLRERGEYQPGHFNEAGENVPPRVVKSPDRKGE